MRSRPAIIALAGLTAAVVNLVVYAVGRAAGGSFEFTADGATNEVDAVTVAGFSVVPLLSGLVVIALLARFASWVIPAAAVAAPVLAIVTIFVMTLPADLDATSTLTLALCHVTLAPISAAAVLALRRKQSTSGSIVVGSATP